MIDLSQQVHEIIMGRVEYLHSPKNPIIAYPGYNHIIGVLETAMAESEDDDEAVCVAIEGETGSGKTTLLEDFARSHPPVATSHGVDYGVLYLKTGSPVNTNGMAAKMLFILGDPTPHKGTQWQKDHRLKQLLRDCKTVMVIIDDLQNLIQPGTEKVFAVVANWLKAIVKETRISFALASTKDGVSQILQGNPELNRLVKFREMLTALDYVPGQECEFAKFVLLVLESMGTAFAEGTSRVELFHRIFYATDGHVGHTATLMRSASKLAKTNGLRTISSPELEQAFWNVVAEVLPNKTNPFVDGVAMELLEV